MARVKSADFPLSAVAGVKTSPQGTGVCIPACQVRLSCFCRFPAQLKVGVECLAQGPEKFLPRKVCAFLGWLQVCMFVVSHTAGHRKECGRWSGSSPRTLLCQPWLGSKLLPEVQVYVRSCSSISSHVIMFLFLSCRVSGRWEWSVSHEEWKKSSPGRCVHFCCAMVKAPPQGIGVHVCEITF